jgi:putative acetyltransferase
VLANALVVRHESPPDYGAIRALLDAAFPIPDDAHHSLESQLVEELRADGDAITDLTLVADLEGDVVGHVTCSLATLGDEPSVAVGPIAVRPELQRQGVGAVLMSTLIATADPRADPELVLLGDPDYYGIFGFEAASRHGITPPASWPDHLFQIKTLRSWDPARAAAFRFAPAFDLLI